MGDSTYCLSDLEFSAYLSGSLTPKARAVMDRHLGDCADCTERLEEQRRAHEAQEALKPAQSDGPEGKVLGDFRIIKEIGRGGFGVVYEAEQISLRRPVALKVLPAHVTLHPSAVERFQREASTAARLHHPGIVDIYAVGEDGGTHYFAMDLIEGVPLNQIIDRMRDEDPELLDGGRLGAVISSVQQQAGQPPRTTPREPPLDQTRSSAWNKTYVETICRLGAQVADALDYAHNAGVIHRDIKPSNILVREEGSAVLMDFGLAREEGLPALTLTGEFAGTPYYVSPEQAMARRVHVDRRTDIYSLGVTLYELLTLRRPFEGTSSQEVLGKIIAKEPSSPRKLNPVIPRDLETIVLIAMEKDPDRRYQSGGDLAADIRRFLDYQPVKARPVGPVTRVIRMATRQRVPIAATAVVLLTIAAALLFHLLQPTGLNLESQPPGAQVFVDGRPAGQTPLRIEDVDSGTHDVVLALEGYSRRSLQLELTRGTSRDVSVRLVASTGLLDCSTEPAGATVVVVDERGTEVGSGKAPLQLTLPRGNYRARASLDFFETQERELRILDDGRLTKLSIALPTVGCAVMFDAEPLGTSVVFRAKDGGEERKLTAPFTEPVLLRPGRYEVLCTAVNHMPQRFVCELARGGSFEKYVSLQDLRSWSIQTRRSGGTPVVADIDGDGWLDVVAAAREGHVLAVSGLEGKLLWLAEVGEPLTGNVLVRDFDLDGDNEVVVIGQNRDTRNSVFVLCLGGADGTERWRRRIDAVSTPSAPGVVPAGPDGGPAITLGLRGAWYCIEGNNGEVRWTHEMEEYGAILDPADLDHDGVPELIGTTGARVRPTGWASVPTSVQCFSAATGAVRWERQIGDVQLSSRAVAYDLDRDGVDDVFCLGRNLSTDPVKMALICCSGVDGRVLLRKNTPGIESGLDGEPLILDRAGKALYLVTTEGLLRFGLEHGRFETVLPMPRGSLANLVVADVDGDASLDAVCSFRNSQVAAYSLEGGERLWQFGTDGAVTRRVALADLDADGALECLFSTRNGSLTCLSGLGRRPRWRARVPGGIRVPATAADLNGDGQKDLVVPGQDGFCRILDGRDGHLLHAFETGWRQTTRPVIGDVDGDDEPEILLGGATGDFAVLRVADGSVLWSFRAEASVLNVPVIFDVDGDGTKEVLVGAEDCRLYCMRGADGERVWRTDALRGPVRNAVSCAPSKDGTGVVILASSDGTDRRGAMTAANTYFYRLDGATGELLSRHDSYGIDQFVARCDANGDGVDDVLMTSADEIRCYEVADANPLWRFVVRDRDYERPFLLPFEHKGRPFCFAVSPVGRCVLLDARRGKAEWWFDLDMPVGAGPVLFDLDGDGTREIVVSVRRGTLLGLRVTDGMLTYSHHFGVGNAGVPPVPLAAGWLALLRSDGLVEVLGSGTPTVFLSGAGGQDLHAAATDGRIASAHTRLRFAWRRGRFDLAREIVRSLPTTSVESVYARLVPDWSELSESLAGAPMTSARLRESIDHFERSLALEPGSADALLGKAACHERMGDAERALAAYRALTKRHPRHLLGLERHARFLHKQGSDTTAALDRYLTALVAASNTVREHDVLHPLVVDTMRGGDHDWTYAVWRRCQQRYNSRDIVALGALITALKDGEEAARESWGKSLPKTSAFFLLERLAKHRQLFEDPAAADRLAQYVRERFEIEEVLVVQAVNYAPSPDGPNPFMAGDIVVSYNKTPVASMPDLDEAERQASLAGLKQVEVVVRRVGEELRLKRPTGRLGIQCDTDRREQRTYTDLRRLYVRAMRAYGSNSPLRTQPDGLFPLGLSWSAAAKSADRVLELDPEAKSVGEDRRVTPNTPARAVLCYDAACLHAMATNETKGEASEEHAKRALALLDESFRLGWTNLDHANSDSDLDAIRDRKQFARILEEARARNGK